MIRVCVVGASGYSAAHLWSLFKQADKGAVAIRGVAVLNPADVPEMMDQFARRGIPVFSSYDSMLDAVRGECDLMCLPVPIHLHVPMACRALEAGCNVLVEKPLCAVLDEVARLRETMRKTGRFVAVGYQNMYGSEVHALKRRLVSGEFGHLASIRGVAGAARTTQYYRRNSWAGRIRTAAGDWVLDSPYNNACAHQLNLLAFLAGSAFGSSDRIATVEAELYRVRPEIENADTACIRCIGAAGVPMLYLTSHAVEKDIPAAIRIAAEKADITWEHFGRGVVIDWKDGRTETLPCEDWNAILDRMFDMVLARVTDPAAFVCTVDVAETQTRIMNAAHASSAVQPVDAAYRAARVQPENPKGPVPETDRTWHVIPGLNDLIDRSAATGKLFSELGAPWAKPGVKVDAAGMTSFAGRGC